MTPYRIREPDGTFIAMIYGQGLWPSWSLWTPPGCPLWDWTPEDPVNHDEEAERQYDHAHP